MKETTPMLWLALAAGGVGFLLGLQLLRVHLIVAGSSILALLCIAVAPAAQWTWLASVAAIFLFAGAVQCGYFAGVVMSSAWTGARMIAPDVEIDARRSVTDVAPNEPKIGSHI